MSWYESAFAYQIYPLGLVGAPFENDFRQEHRLLKLVDDGWVHHLKRLGVTCVILNPVFQSGTHGYDTIDYGTVDDRLGTADDLRAVVDAFHEAGMRVLLDGVFNHVGRGFWAFQDVLEKRQTSEYASWFNIDWGGNNGYGDGLSYACWEGVDSLVQLNHHDFGLNDYCIEVVRSWERDYDIDGLRLDVAYCLDAGFLGYLRRVANELTEKRGSKFLLLGETMFGDYNRWMNDDACDTVTNYECYKGLWSSMNAANMHEIAYALERQSGDAPWDLYTGAHLLDFVDNHDVARIATQLEDERHLRPLYGLLFGMCGVPCVYYGSEWGVQGEKLPGDRELRPAFNSPEWNELTDCIAALAAARASSKALVWGSYRQVLVQPQLLAFQREFEGECVIVVVNTSDKPESVPFEGAKAVDIITGKRAKTTDALPAAPFSCHYWKAS